MNLFFKQQKFTISKMITVFACRLLWKRNNDDVNLFNAPIWWDYQKIPNFTCSWFILKQLFDKLKRFVFFVRQC
jgi:hypothetical protein